MAKNVDIIDVMIAVHRGELKASVSNGYFMLENTKSGERVRLNESDAVPVVHGRWEKCGGDLHSSGYAIYCSICHKNHFVHYKYSLGGLYGCKELFEKPKYCPSCGAVMGCEE